MLIPRPYQEAGRDFLAGRTRALLADAMRVGKTPQAILACEKVGAQNILVVCPAIAVPHWIKEFERWWRRAEPSTTFYVVSYDRARLSIERLKEIEWDVMIVDECHFAKNPTAQRTKMIYGKDGLGYCAERIWVLSGTPAPKHAGELWPMLRAFGVTGMTYYEFTRHYCVVTHDGRIIGTKEKHIPELKRLLSKIMLRRTLKDVAPEMPGIDFQFLEVEPHVVAADVKVPAGLSDDELLVWLEANSATDKSDRQAVAQAKALPLAEQIEFAISNELLKQTVVFGWHVQPLETVCDILATKGISADVINGSTSETRRVDILDRFRRGELQVLIGNILAMGTAADASAASHGYFLELDWVPGNNLQAANRMVSMDKKEPVTVDVVTWPGSADDRVQNVLVRRVRELSQLM